MYAQKAHLEWFLSTSGLWVVSIQRLQGQIQDLRRGVQLVRKSDNGGASGESSARKLEHSVVPPEITSARLLFYTLEKKRALSPVEQVMNGGRWRVETIFTRSLWRQKTAIIIFPPRNKRNKTYPYLVLCCFLSFRRHVSPWKDKTLRRTI